MKQIQVLPSIEIDLGGARMTSGAMRCLMSFRVQQVLSQPTVAELVFRDPPGPLDELASVEVGTSLRLDADNSGIALIEGEVTAIEQSFLPDGEREVRIRAYDPIHRLRKRQPVRAHVDVSAGSLGRELAGDCGLEFENNEDGPIWPRVIQHDLSDFDLLQRLCERAGFYFTTRQGVLHLLTLEGIGPAVPIRYGDELIEARVEVNADPACRSVAADGWSPLEAQRHHAVAEDARLGTRVDLSAPPAAVGSDGMRVLSGTEVLSDEHALALAQGELDRRRGHEVTLWAVTDGNPRLRPGAWVDLETPATGMRGRHVVSSAIHTLDDRRGFISEVTSEIPDRRPASAALRTTLGRVVDVADPDGLGRVRVALPSIGDLETDWIEVLMAGAGAGKGLIATPAPDDHVLVLLGSPEASQAIVLGSVYGPTVPPDPGVDADRVVRYTLTTPSGQRITLADDTKTLRLEDGNGNKIELSPQGLRVDAVVDISMSAPGRRLLFRGKAIDFEQA
jgi:uncharacterized protein involved in type VI secretion and phage assembly